MQNEEFSKSLAASYFGYKSILTYGLVHSKQNKCCTQFWGFASTSWFES